MPYHIEDFNGPLRQIELLKAAKQVLKEFVESGPTAKSMIALRDAIINIEETRP